MPDGFHLEARNILDADLFGAVRSMPLRIA